MTAGEIAAVVTGATALITAVATAVANLVLLLSMLRDVRTTHRLVNQERTDARVYQAITTDALRQAGVPVPPDPSLPAPAVATAPGG